VTAASGGHVPPTTLSVVVCAYTLDRWADIEEAVASLRAQTRRPDQVVLVADHNETLLEKARLAFPDVTSVPNTGLQGLSGARNAGVAVATGDVLAFLDDDAAAEPAWVESLLAAYADPDVIGVGGWVVRPGRRRGRRGSPRSSSGSWAAATPGCRPSARRSAIRSAPT
jgi:glucosyl-dolichyl phosphate glucuronosyltransferase